MRPVKARHSTAARATAESQHQLLPSADPRSPVFLDNQRNYLRRRATKGNWLSYNDSVHSPDLVKAGPIATALLHRLPRHARYLSHRRTTARRSSPATWRRPVASAIRASTSRLQASVHALDRQVCRQVRTRSARTRRRARAEPASGNLHRLPSAARTRSAGSREIAGTARIRRQLWELSCRTGQSARDPAPRRVDRIRLRPRRAVRRMPRGS